MVAIFGQLAGVGQRSGAAQSLGGLSRPPPSRLPVLVLEHYRTLYLPVPSSQTNSRKLSLSRQPKPECPGSGDHHAMTSPTAAATQPPPWQSLTTKCTSDLQGGKERPWTVRLPRQHSRARWNSPDAGCQSTPMSLTTTYTLDLQEGKESERVREQIAVSRESR
jgi:hypothetical protein